MLDSNLVTWPGWLEEEGGFKVLVTVKEMPSHLSINSHLILKQSLYKLCSSFLTLHRNLSLT